MSAGHAVPTLDLGVLLPLEQAIGTDMMGKMVERLDGETQRLIAALQTAQSQQNVSALAEAAHEIRGMFANIGCTLVVSLASSVEDAARTKDGAPMGQLVPELILRMGQATRYLQGKYPA